MYRLPALPEARAPFKKPSMAATSSSRDGSASGCWLACSPFAEAASRQRVVVEGGGGGALRRAVGGSAGARVSEI